MAPLLKQAKQLLASTPIAVNSSYHSCLYLFLLPSRWVSSSRGAWTEWGNEWLEKKSQTIATSLGYQIMDPLSMARILGS